MFLKRRLAPLAAICMLPSEGTRTREMLGQEIGGFAAFIFSSGKGFGFIVEGKKVDNPGFPTITGEEDLYKAKRAPDVKTEPYFGIDWSMRSW
ncbi:hypothetical protein BDV23DRAFT_151029 [Aspergillus alliaceus]|uniref:Uncharacterized protein n=1 Tax=Petromyces alliaceus TaxID=209559 RepID=A0A5N7CEE3_PETAA|nr:hypothetical protein BDV23DRAFT_151029 [Aspergillus alliaceus]